EHLAGAAAFECAVVAGEIEVALFLVGIMALGAVVLDERKDLVLKSNFLLGRRRGGSQPAKENETDACKTPCGNSRHITRYHQTNCVLCKPIAGVNPYRRSGRRRNALPTST